MKAGTFAQKAMELLCREGDNLPKAAERMSYSLSAVSEAIGRGKPPSQGMFEAVRSAYCRDEAERKSLLEAWKRSRRMAGMRDELREKKPTRIGPPAPVPWRRRNA